MKAVVAAFNQEKALVGAFSVITNLRMELFQALTSSRTATTAVVTPRQMSRLGEKLPIAARIMNWRLEAEIVKNTCHWPPDIDGAKFQTLQWDLEDWKEYLENAIITQYKKVPILRLNNTKSSEH